MTGYFTDKIGGYYSTQLGIFIVLAGSILFSATEPKKPDSVV